MGYSLRGGTSQGAPTNPIEENEAESDEISEMAATEIREPDARQASKKINTGRTPGIDSIPAELNRANRVTSQ